MNNPCTSLQLTSDFLINKIFSSKQDFEKAVLVRVNEKQNDAIVSLEIITDVSQFSPESDFICLKHTPETAAEL